MENKPAKAATVKAANKRTDINKLSAAFCPDDTVPPRRYDYNKLSDKIKEKITLFCTFSLQNLHFVV
jgi:hypothetical protein